jgi:hydrogenase expression/formation protein HypC
MIAPSRRWPDGEESAMCLGVPAEVVEIPDADVPRARVAISGVERMVSTDLLVEEGLGVGDWVLVHVGFALSRIDADEAAQTLDQIKKLGNETFETELESFSSSMIQ